MSLNLLIAYLPFVGGFFVLLAGGMIVRRKLRTVEARLDRIRASVTQLEQIEARRVLDAVRSGTLGNITATETDFSNIETPDVPVAPLPNVADAKVGNGGASLSLARWLRQPAIDEQLATAKQLIRAARRT
jgi:hypothetical protein